MISAPDWSYWQAITEKASLTAYEDNPLTRLLQLEEGQPSPDLDPLLSIETNPSFDLLDMAAYARHYPQEFLAAITTLDPDFQDMLIAYYLLGKKEAWIGTLYNRTQSRTSEEILRASKAVASQSLLGQPLNLTTVRTILTAANLETHSLPRQRRHKRKKLVSLSALLVSYQQTKSFRKTAKRYKIHYRPLLSLFRRTADTLKLSQDVRQAALGCYIAQLIYRRNNKPLYSKHHPRIFFTDSPQLGQFTVDVRQPGSSQLFSSSYEPR